uniref:Histone deacetylase 11 n=1 Tax=Gorilla gorilla gorilla TaxID=9595 RepID=A0A2I2Z7S9_GORGO
MLHTTQLYQHVPETRWPIVYSPRYNITFMGLEKLHPFDAGKWGKVINFLKEEKLLSDSMLVEAREASEEDLLVVHTRRYLNELKRPSGGRWSWSGAQRMMSTWIRWRGTSRNPSRSTCPTWWYTMQAPTSSRGTALGGCPSAQRYPASLLTPYLICLAWGSLDLSHPVSLHRTQTHCCFPLQCPDPCCPACHVAPPIRPLVLFVF